MKSVCNFVSREYDVIVVGGGITGLAAARTAAVQGLRTAVIESSGALGREIGRARNMFVDLEKHSSSSQTIAAWLKGLKEKKGWFGSMGLDTCCSEAVFDDMLEESGVDVWFHVLPAQLLTADCAVEGIRIASKNGYDQLRASTVIDASADGKIARAWYAEKPAIVQNGAIHVLYNHVDQDIACPQELTLQLPSFGEVAVSFRPTFLKRIIAA
jgi:flavin-dependent dehydrogenase